MKRLLLIFILFAAAGQLTAQLRIRAMSFNIRLDVASDGDNRWELRKDKVTGLMNFHAADFIGAQEVLHHQLEYLLQQLPDYRHIGVARDDGNKKGEYSCILYRADAYELIHENTIWLSPTPQQVSKGWDAALPRVCTYGLFRHRQSGRRIWVFNTHFDHIGKQAREASAKLIDAEIQKVNASLQLPVVLMGDFNSRPEDSPVQYLRQVMNNAREVSLSAPYGPADTWNAFKFRELPDGCIDYIFISKDPKMKVVKFATLTDSYDLKYPSDHFPVVADIILQTGKHARK